MLNILVYRIPKKLPAGMQQIVKQLQKTKSKDACLRKAYIILSKRFRGKKLYFLQKPLELFTTNLDTIWNTRTILNCTTVNYLLRTLLIKSGKFKDKDITSHWTLIWGVSPHQYLTVSLGNQTIDIDLWGHANKVPFGTHAGF